MQNVLDIISLEHVKHGAGETVEVLPVWFYALYVWLLATPRCRMFMLDSPVTALLFAIRIVVAMLVLCCC